MTEQGRISLDLKSKKEMRNELDGEIKAIQEKRTELLATVTEESPSEEMDQVDQEATQLSEQEEAKKKAKEELESEIAKLEKELEAIQEIPEEDQEERNMDNKELLLQERSALETFVRTKGQVRADGLTSTDIGALIPEAIIHNPQMEVTNVVDLAKLVTKTKVSTASGKHPILERPTARLSTVAELAENPKLAEPTFLDVAWEVATYRGALPLSQEAIDDSAVDLVALVARHAQEIKINTTNYEIAEVLKTFTAKPVSTADDLKEVYNVALNPAYKGDIVASQSFFNALDTLKDGDNRYYMQDDVTSPTGKNLFGRKIIAVVPDEALGAAGEAKAFIGDLSRAVLFADRKDLALQWVDHHIYGRYLAVVTRFDVVKADANAGFFVTYTAPAGA